MASPSSITYANIIDIKQEAEPIHNQPVIVHNAVYLPEFSQQLAVKSEPEENFCMEIDGQNADTGIIQDVGSQNFLKISSVTQGVDFDDVTTKKGSKRGRKPKNVKALKVTTKMKPVKNVKTVQKAVKAAAKVDKKLNKIQKPRKSKAKVEGNIGVTIEDSGGHPMDLGQDNSVPSLKTLKPTRKSKTVPQKPSNSAQLVQKNIKIIQLVGSSEEPVTVDSLKIPIQKSQKSPSKLPKNAQLYLKTHPKSSKSESLQSSFIVDKNKTSQLKLKISKPSKSLEPTETPKNPRQRKKQPQKDSQPTIPVKQESTASPIVKSEPANFLPDDGDLELVDYEPKITKKRKVIRLDCDHCGKVFKSKYSIIWHMKEHMLTMPFNCKVCGKGFSYERSFKQHELTHAAKIKCEICGKSLKPHAMYYHMKYRHTNEKTHQCPICPKAFKTKDNIARHIMRHNMEFPCTICGRKFAENSRLQMHLNMHENPEQFHCSICNKSFEHIDRHMKRLHAQKRERNLKCQYCEYASDSKQTLRRHEEMHEKRNEILQSNTKKRKIKLKIIEMKTFECKVCNVVLQTKSGYKSHLRHYHKGKDQVNAIIANEVRDESSMESDNFVEIKVEEEEVRVVQ